MKVKNLNDTIINNNLINISMRILFMSVGLYSTYQTQTHKSYEITQIHRYLKQIMICR